MATLEDLIPTTGYPRAPDAMNRNWFDEALESGPAQSAMAIPAVAGATGALRTLAAANNVAKGARIGKMVQDAVQLPAGIGQFGATAAPVVTPAAGAARTLAAVGGTLALGGGVATGLGGQPSAEIGGGRGVVNPPLASALPPVTPMAAPAGQVTVPPVGVTPEQAAVEPLATSGQRIGQMDRDAQHLRDLQAIQQRIDASGGGGGFTSGPGMVALGNPGPAAAQKFFDEANLRNAAGKTIMTRQGARPDEQALKAALEPVENRAKQEGLETKVNAERASDLARIQSAGQIAQMRDATDRRGQDVQADSNAATVAENRARTLATIRGQDVQAGTEKAKLQNDQMNKDRDFKIALAKSGREVAESEYKTRTEANTKLIDRISATLPPVNGKPDTAGQARVAESIQAGIVAMQQQLRAKIQADPNNKLLVEQLDKLERDGAKALSPERERMLIEGVQARVIAEREQADSSGLGRWWRGTSGGVTGVAPVSGLKRETQFLGPDVMVAPDGTRIPAELLKGPDGRPRRNFDNIIR